MNDNQQQHKGQRPPRLRLPYEKRPSDIGSWSYDHRVGLCITLIAYLLLAIVFVSSKIAVGNKSTLEGFYVDLQEPTPPPTPEELLQQQMQAQDFRDVDNRISNENADRTEANSPQLDERLRDDRGTNAGEIYDEADEVQRRIRANRDAYEKGLREEQAIANRSKNKDNAKSQDVKVKGRVTVSFSLVNPVRNSVKLVVPAYLCEGGGEVVVNITVNRNGQVTAAAIDRGNSTGDDCITSAALQAARDSRFNVNGSAPDKQTGTISYIFIPQ